MPVRLSEVFGLDEIGGRGAVGLVAKRRGVAALLPAALRRRFARGPWHVLRAALSDCGGKAFGRPRHRCETGSNRGVARTSSQSGVASLRSFPPHSDGATRGGRGMSCAQRFRTAVARPSEGRDTAVKPGPTVGVGRTSSQSGVASLRSFPPHSDGATRGDRGMSCAQRFRTAVARSSEGRDTAVKPGPTAGLVGPRRKAAWRRCAPSRRTPTALRAGGPRSLASGRGTGAGRGFVGGGGVGMPVRANGGPDSLPNPGSTRSFHGSVGWPP